MCSWAKMSSFANTVIGDGVTIGADSIIYPNVTVYAGCTLGARVIIHSGTVTVPMVSASLPYGFRGRFRRSVR